MDNASAKQRKNYFCDEQRMTTIFTVFYDKDGNIIGHSSDNGSQNLVITPLQGKDTFFLPKEVFVIPDSIGEKEYDFVCSYKK